MSDKDTAIRQAQKRANEIGEPIHLIARRVAGQLGDYTWYQGDLMDMQREYEYVETFDPQETK